RTINVNTRSVTGGIARDSAADITGQVAADLHTTTVSTVTAHGGVGQGAVAADIHTGRSTAGETAPHRLGQGHVATDLHPGSRAAGVTVHRGVGQCAVADDIQAGTIATGVGGVAVHRHVN